MKRQILSLLIFLIPAVLISACGFYQPISSEATDPTVEGAYRINPVFWDYYHLMGGERIFGPAITNIFTFEGKKMQYVENGLLVYDPQKRGDEYSFSNLGVQLNIFEAPEIDAGYQGGLIINEYLIHPDFVDLYRRLGPDVVGAPLTNPQENFALGRVEQHFQNLGFYFRLDDSEKEVYLLAYGRAVCGTLCQFRGHTDNAVHTSAKLSEPFASFIYRLSPSATGAALGGPFTGEDGQQEVILEHMVVYDIQGNVFPRPMVLLLGYDPEPLVERLDNPILTFKEIEGSWGHNILIHFDDYINYHGGYRISGMPVSEIYEHNHDLGIIRQCFTNLCLDYYRNEQSAKVRPAPLGIEYKSTFYPALSVVGESGTIQQEGVSFTKRKIVQSIFQLKIWESSPLITSSESQTISAGVFFNEIPQADQQLTLTVYVPNADPITVSMPPTGPDGQTAIALAPVANTNGTLITYEVCLTLSEDASQCTEESFLIWGN